MILIDAYLIDRWTLVHILLWSLFGWWALRSKEAPLLVTLMCGLVIGLAWEVMEMYIEILWGFREPFWNRWLFDPASDVLGTFIGWMIARKINK